MTSLELLPELGEMTREDAEQWIAAALAEAAALRRYDDRLCPHGGGTEMATARRLHDAWCRWADDAEVLYARIAPLRRLGPISTRHVNGADDLEHAIGRTRAMLQITPEKYARAYAQSMRGEGIDIEDARRHLALRRRQREEGRELHAELRP